MGNPLGLGTNCHLYLFAVSSYIERRWGVALVTPEARAGSNPQSWPTIGSAPLYQFTKSHKKTWLFCPPEIKTLQSAETFGLYNKSVAPIFLTSTFISGKTRLPNNVLIIMLAETSSIDSRMNCHCYEEQRTQKRKQKWTQHQATSDTHRYHNEEEVINAQCLAYHHPPNLPQELTSIHTCGGVYSNLSLRMRAKKVLPFDNNANLLTSSRTEVSRISSNYWTRFCIKVAHQTIF